MAVDVIEPAVQGGFAAKASIGEQVRVVADVYADGHDDVDAELVVHTQAGDVEVVMDPLGNDRFEAYWSPTDSGRASFEVVGRVEPADEPERAEVGASGPMPLTVERELARCSAWYELFPRSAGDAGRHGRLRDVTDLLPRIAAMGFDIVYLPPIHPIGTTHRKGRDNNVVSTPGDPGSPWAIGARDGGHDAVHRRLGAIDDVDALTARAHDLGLEVAMDLAMQCSPDHPWVDEHPEWFRHRADGTIRCAENPPKRYEDIYPLDYAGPAWRTLWHATLDLVEHWIGHGVDVFRVDNPHTKPFELWRWLIDEVHRNHPEVVFLAEAFTRPRVMERLAKVGFSQSYTYFTWRDTPAELEEYFTDLTTRTADFMRPNVWPNTPDILARSLQTASPAAFAARAVMAATLSANWGVYGPAFENLEHTPAEPGGEEYAASEKYQIRTWPPPGDSPMGPLLTRLNMARRDHEALRHDRWLRFHRTDEADRLLCWSKMSPDGTDVVLCVVNVDPDEAVEGWVHLDETALDLDDEPYTVRDLLDDAEYRWKGPHNFVRLDPRVRAAHVFVVEGPATGRSPDAHRSRGVAGEATSS